MLCMYMCISYIRYACIYIYIFLYMYIHEFWQKGGYLFKEIWGLQKDHFACWSKTASLNLAVGFDICGQPWAQAWEWGKTRSTPWAAQEGKISPGSCPVKPMQRSGSYLGAGSPMAKAAGTVNLSCMAKSAFNSHMWSHFTRLMDSFLEPLSPPLFGVFTLALATLSFG